MASPFLQLSMRNFAGLLLAVALGIVAAPHLLGRHVSQNSVAPGGAVKRTAWALVAVAVVAASLPPLAVYSRIGFEEALSKGIENAAIPLSLTEASGLGWVKVCDLNSAAGADLAAACAKASGQRGFVRLQDLAFTTDGFVVAAPGISGLDPMLEIPLLLGVVLAAVLAGNALIAGLVAADTEIRMTSVPQTKPLDFRAGMLGAVLLVSAGLIATAATIGTGLLAAEGFALLAAGIFPALILGLHWRHMNALGRSCSDVCRHRHRGGLSHRRAVLAGRVLSHDGIAVGRGSRRRQAICRSRRGAQRSHEPRSAGGGAGDAAPPSRDDRQLGRAEARGHRSRRGAGGSRCRCPDEPFFGRAEAGRGSPVSLRLGARVA